MKATNSLKIIFAGTPEFSVVTLQKLLNSQHKIIAVYTQPDRPAGRGRKLTASPVKRLALENNLPIYQPQTLRDTNEQKNLAALNADVMVVVAYGLLLPLAVLNAPRFGCLNTHPSLLPRWRGAAPIQWTILAGDTQTGVAIMQMDEGLDTGPLLHQVKCAVQPTDTSKTLHDRLAILGADILVETLENLAARKPIPQNNDPTQIKYATKITKANAKINWQLPAIELERQIRAFNPIPIAYTTAGVQTVRIWQARIDPSSAQKNIPPGTITAISASGIHIATGTDILSLQTIQFPGGNVITAADVAHAEHSGFHIGDVLL